MILFFLIHFEGFSREGEHFKRDRLSIYSNASLMEEQQQQQQRNMMFDTMHGALILQSCACLSCLLLARHNIADNFPVLCRNAKGMVEHKHTACLDDSGISACRRHPVDLISIICQYWE